MPQTKKKKSTGRTTAKSRKKNGTVRKTKEQSRREYEIKRDIQIVLIIAISIFLFICNFNVAGKVGSWFSEVMFGLCGLLAYLIPLFIGASILFVLANPKDKLATIKLVAACVIVFLIQTLIDMYTGVSKVSEKYSVKEFYLWCLQNRKGGGVFASSLAYGLLSLLNRIGSVLLIIVLILVCLIILFEHKFIDNIKYTKEQLAAKSQDERLIRDEYEEERARKNEERREKRRIEQEQRRLDYERRAEERRIREEETEARKKLERQQKEEKDILISTPKPKNNFPDITTNTKLGPAIIESVSAQENEDIHEINLNGFNPSEPDKGIQSLQNDIQPDEIIVISEPEPEIRSEIPMVRSELNKPAAPSENIQSVIPKKPVAKAPINNDPSGIGITNAEHKGYVFPPIELLSGSNKSSKGDSQQQIRQTAQKLQDTLAMFGVEAAVTDISQGPTVTRFELQPKMGTKVSRIKNLSDDIKLNLAAADIRIEAPIPGKAAIGIEVPNQEPVPVIFRDMIESDEFKKCDSKLAFAVGKDIAGKTIIYDIDKFPHVLIAGATGAGKSVCINTLIMSIIYRAHPDDVKFIMIDPKVVELSVYNGIPHLICPVVTDMKKAAATLNYAVNEMMERYKKFADKGVRDITGYNKVVASEPESEIYKKMPYIVIIVDEFADLIISARNEVEDAICRLAALARACGIHLVLATQRPSADVITGLIKSNMPSRIAFSVASQVESRIILDIGGAEELLGKGDMLFYPKGLKKPVRLQGGFIKDEDVFAVTDFLKKNNTVGYDEEFSANVEKFQSSSGSGSGNSSNDSDSGYDDMFVEVGRFIVETQKASIGNIQRKFKMGFNRAARIMDQLAEEGIVGPEEGTKPRAVYMTSVSDFESYIESHGL